ncbi:MAG: FtsQ-type POTRA domain-containing protein [Alphaproteobacteria bacterium]|nr:MAG: FtsQ-type POTRA domain-containing protein [Alphaproteobacteria bacterium]
MFKKYRGFAYVLITTSVFIFYIKKAERYIVKNVNVFGTIACHEDHIVQLVKNKKMYLINIAKLKQQICELDFIKNCIIKKEWPDEITIFVEEYVPAFQIKTDNQTVFVDKTGHKINKMYPIKRIIISDNVLTDEIELIIDLLSQYQTFSSKVASIYKTKLYTFNFMFHNSQIIKCNNKLDKCIKRYLTLPKNMQSISNVIDLRHPLRTIFY